MSKEVKLSQEELQGIKMIAEKETAAITQLGNIEYQLKTLEFTKDRVLESINKLGEERVELMESLQKEYGLGTINIDTGEFTPTE